MEISMFHSVPATFWSSNITDPKWNINFLAHTEHHMTFNYRHIQQHFNTS